MPQFSVIIPTLNEAEFLPYCLKYLQQQEFHDYEIVVVDGGSQDATIEIAKKSNCKIVNSAKGRALQMNAGVKEATGDILFFLHGDSHVPENVFLRIQDILQQNPKSPGGAFYVTIEAQEWIFWWITLFSNLRCWFSSYPYGDQGIFIKRNLFLEIGGFPEVSLFEEVLLVRKLQKYGVLSLINEPRMLISSRRWKEEGITYTIIRNIIISLAFYIGVSPEKLARFYPVRKKKLNV